LFAQAVKEAKEARADAPSNPLMISEDETKETNEPNNAPSAPTIPLPVPQYPSGWDENSAKVRRAVLLYRAAQFISSDAHCEDLLALCTSFRSNPFCLISHLLR